MLQNYFKTAWRSILSQKTSTILNVAGLTLGITSSLILFLLVSYHTGFDDHHAKRDRIYRIVNQSKSNEAMNYQAGVPSLLPEAFRADFPEAEEVVFTSYRHDALILVPRANGEWIKFREPHGVVYTEPAFFRVFDRNVLIGDAGKGLDEPSEAVISSSMAKKYFGREDAIGEVFQFEKRDFRVSAILEDAPANTDFPFNIMLSYATVKADREKNGWHSVWSNEQCYFLLKEGESIDAVTDRLPQFSTKHLGEDDFDKTTYFVQPLSEMHFDPRFSTYSFNTVPIEVLIALGAIAIILIITACVNFVNLATAEAARRSKEVGIRKSLGSTRLQLVFQFIGETTLVTIISVVVALGCTQLVLGFINPFLKLSLSLDLGSNKELWLVIGCIIIGVSALSGIYPAFVISGFKPIVVLKNTLNNKASSGYHVRRALVVLQFFISQLFIITTIVMVNQLNYWEEHDLGFAKEGIILAPIPALDQKSGESLHITRARTLRDEMAKIPGVITASLASTPPSSGSTSWTDFTVEGMPGQFVTQAKYVDGNYIDLFELKLLAGRGLEDFDTTQAYVVNETFAKIVGFNNPADIVGRNILLWGRTLPVVGVVRDFHTTSLMKEIEPTILLNGFAGYRTLSLRVDMKQSHEILNLLKAKWEATYPEHLFEYTYLDDTIRQFYEGHRRTNILLMTFTGIAIIIGALGLFGLVSFMANQKVKEIGIRKVLGATVESIILIFAKEFGVLILIGFVLAAPMGWWSMNIFLREFAYKVEPGIGVLLLGLLISASIALITVSYRSFRVATLNPAHTLRYE